MEERKFGGKKERERKEKMMMRLVKKDIFIFKDKLLFENKLKENEEKQSGNWRQGDISVIIVIIVPCRK